MKICLLGVADANYLKRYIVAFDSLLSNTTKDFDIRILPIECSEEEKDTVKYFFTRDHTSRSFEYLEFSDEQKNRIAKYPSYSRGNTFGYITQATLFKMHAVEQAKSLGYDAVVYLDPDILIRSNIDGLFDIAASIEKIGAVPSSTSASTTGIMNSFNAGVLVFNLHNMHTSDFEEFDTRVIEYKSRCGDQMIFNKMYSSIYTKIDKKFNASAESRAVVYHFTGIKKPWNSNSLAHDIRFGDYWQYVSANSHKFKSLGLGL